MKKIEQSGKKEMYQRTAKVSLEQADRRLKHQINIALGRAQGCLENRVPFKMGGKTPDGLDCSGLVEHCYPRVLPQGTEKQFEKLKKWLFFEHDMKYTEEGDIVFFAEKERPDVIAHVGIVLAKKGENITIIHSSELRGGVVRDTFSYVQNILREYFAKAVGKIRPFLFRCFLEDELNREVKNADREVT